MLENRIGVCFWMYACWALVPYKRDSTHALSYTSILGPSVYKKHRKMEERKGVRERGREGEREAWRMGGEGASSRSRFGA